MDLALAELVWSLVPEWHENARCRGHQDLFFVEAKAGPTVVAQAVEICRAMCSACPVFAQCRADVDEHQDACGFRAGETAVERATRWRRSGPTGHRAEVAARRRRVVELRAEGLSYREVAGRLGVSRSVVIADAQIATAATDAA